MTCPVFFQRRPLLRALTASALLSIAIPLMRLANLISGLALSLADREKSAVL